MPTGYLKIKDKIVFPPVNTEKEAHIKGLLRSIGEFMGAKLESKLETIITVDIPKDRSDIYLVLSKIVAVVKAEQNNPKVSEKPEKEAAK